MKTLDINIQAIKPLDLANLPALDSAYENAAEEQKAKMSSTNKDDYNTVKHIPAELAGNVW